MKSISYLKIDLRTIGKQVLLILLYPLFLLIFFRNTGMISWMSLFTLPTYTCLPFHMTTESTGKKMVFTLPAKVSSIVLGRFLFLLLTVIYTAGITISGFFLFHTAESTQPVTLLFYLAGIFSIIILSSIQYIIFYRFGEMSKMLITLITLLPAFIISLSIDKLGEKIESFTSIYAFIQTNTQWLLLGMILLDVIILVSSVFICISICKKKDI